MQVQGQGTRGRQPQASLLGAAHKLPFLDVQLSAGLGVSLASGSEAPRGCTSCQTASASFWAGLSGSPSHGVWKPVCFPISSPSDFTAASHLPPETASKAQVLCCQNWLWRGPCSSYSGGLGPREHLTEGLWGGTRNALHDKCSGSCKKKAYWGRKGAHNVTLPQRERLPMSRHLKIWC